MRVQEGKVIENFDGIIIKWNNLHSCGTVVVPELERSFSFTAFEFWARRQGSPQQGEVVTVGLTDDKELFEVSRKFLSNKEESMKDDVPPNAPRGRIIDITVYRVISNTDLTEGKGMEYVLATYDDMREAERHAVGSGVAGTKCPIKQERVKVVKLDDDTYFELGTPILTKFVDKHELRLRALAKLTQEEKVILGLLPSFSK